ncbi:MAG: GNAT family N-acetyltransferase [Pseudomonadota bacterium]
MSEMMGRTSVKRVAREDAAAISALAREIWYAHYAAIISKAQIEYMLAQRYDPEIIRAELARGDVWWDKLLVNGRITGFASYFLTDNAGEMKLDKLYVHHDHQRKGYGSMLLDRVLGITQAYGCTALLLAVNKHNHTAITAYRKYGFRIAESVVKDIGGGFVMDDYIMVKDV